MLVASVAVSLVGNLGCGGQTRPCRAGTVWLTVRLPIASSADRLSISVSVNGAAPTVSQLTLPVGSAGGGSIEIAFPGGYPAGAEAVVGVTSFARGVLVGSRSAELTLAPSCSALVLDFSIDAGLEGLPGAGGSTGQAGGADGVSDAGAGAGGATTGVAGTSGEAGGGGQAGADTGAQGGAPSVADGGPVDGRSSGASGGAGASESGGTGGGAAGGGRGGGGPGGTSNAGGRGGGTVATGGGGAGGARPCVPTGQENCFDGIDNDCNGSIDCADDSCYPVAQCVPLDPTLGPVGSSVAAGATCPSYAPTARVLQSGLVAAGCTGCGCATGTAGLTCTANLFSYATAADCGDPTAPGAAAGPLDSTEGCFTPAWAGPSTAASFGFRADAFQATPTGVCAPTGTPTKGTPVWNTIARFCSIPAAGGGCGARAACVPRQVAADGPCVLIEGAQTCQAGLRSSVWFTGYLDGRSCAACACGAPTGGDCTSTLIAVGNASSCADTAIEGYLRTSGRLCVTGTAGISSPGVVFTGTPVAPTCRSTAPMTGALTTTGPLTLCCQ
jgi:hypothetical protein